MIQTTTSIILVTYAILYITGGLTLLKGISGFRTQLRAAYVIILAGILLEAIVHTGEALAQLLSWWDQSWFEGIQVIFYILAPLLIYVGTRKFGRLLQIKTFSTSFSLTLITGIALMIVVGFLKGGGPQGPISFQVGFTALLVWLLFMGTWTLIQVWHQTSQLYKKSVYWLAWAIGLLGLATSIFLVRQFISNDGTLLLMISLFVISGLALCQAAREFYTIRGKNLGELKNASNITSSVDIVVYTASLASNPRDIDPLLDDMRAITTKGLTISAADQEKLRQLYLQLEQYLIKNDPVRTYERDMLRELITRKLTEHNALAHTFWPPSAHATGI